MLFKKKRNLIDPVALTSYDSTRNVMYKSRKDKDNIFPVGITDREFTNYIIKLLLGHNWCVVDPLEHDQINEVALEEIIYKLTGKSVKDRN